VLYPGLFHRPFLELFPRQRWRISHTDHCGGLFCAGVYSGQVVLCARQR